MVPHPATQIMAWSVFAVMTQTLQSLPVLGGLTSLLALLAFSLHERRLFELMYRARWIFLSLMLIYAYATPGDALWQGMFAPSREGVEEGALQLLRLLSVLSGLAILLTSLTREKLISGIYALLYPLRYVGLAPQRAAVRLALTLHYAETAMRETASDWRGTIATTLAAKGAGDVRIALEMTAPNWADAVLLCVTIGMLAGMWL